MIILNAGYVRSSNDQDLHWISAEKLLKLYRLVAYKRYCKLVNNIEDTLGYRLTVDDIILYPRSDGNYNLTDAIIRHLRSV